ncbi:two-component sensor histidine kinase [Caenimonas sedimenti]|uniref:histidine kinase n=1 Tax=Caenimonas sedimenti TaxID=2596921 RepID=A0A562ZHI9_9BURK|nr:ATP-binding protein [Caenimonas sedimenti]TWO68060.1 two-component sensor histidine kinase [Caenimonas sedimenti]
MSLHLHPSLFRHLMAWTLGALVVTWAAFMLFGYRTGIHEADELTDGHLASVASLLLTQRVTEFAPAPDAATLGNLTDLKAHDYQQSMSVFIWDASGKLQASTGEAPTPLFTDTEGFETVAMGANGQRWRSFSRWDGQAHQRKISVLLSIAERDALAEDIADQVAEPGIWLLPVVALMLGFAVHRGLRPLWELSRQVHRLDIHRDTELKAPPHTEFKAIVDSINTLIQRYNAALTRERQLASEIAHELRTPLASLVLNAAALQQELSDSERTDAMKRVVLDASRAGAVMADLLSLARTSRTELAEGRQDVDLASLAREVVAEYAQTALDADHEIGLEAPDTCPMRGHPILLQIALRNLIENALHHTPRGTVIEVRVSAAPLQLEVRDNGVGLDSKPVETTGIRLGLGHQVVRRIAVVHDGRFDVVDASGGWRVYRIELGSGEAVAGAA